jgi:Ca2+-binding EF-hand superfamily protein
MWSHLPAAVVLTFACCVTTIAEESTGETREAMLLLSGGPLHVRMHIGLGGKPLAAARKEFAERLFATLDTNADGKLSRAEAQQSPLLRTKERASAKNFLQSIGAGDKPVLLRDIEKTIERYGGETVVYRQDEAASEPDQKVFEFLDINSDAKIDVTEISLAADRMLDKDSDRDMCVTFDEFAPAAVADPNDIVARLNQAPKPSATMSDRMRDLRDPFLARRVLVEYDKNRDRSLTADEIGWTAEQLAFIDVNKDQKLDVMELAAIQTTPVDLELAVDLAPREGTTAGIQILTPGVKRLDLQDRPDFVKLQFRDAVISVSHRQIDPIARTMEAAMRVFNRLDADANGYLEASEVTMSIRFENGLFDLMDEDHDGKVFGDEMKRYVAVRGEPAATTCRVNLYDTGFGFFLALDRNGDGRISERERRNMHAALVELDRNQDQVITAQEPVRHFHLEFVRGTYVLFGTPEQASTAQLPAFQRRPAVGPVWFQAMDRNNDGDLSWEEFQASRQDFDAIDHDQDGLIDPQEAIHADEEYHRQRPTTSAARD